MNKAQTPWSCDCAHPAALQKEMQMGYVFDRASGDSKMSPFSPELEASTQAASREPLPKSRAFSWFQWPRRAHTRGRGVRVRRSKRCRRARY